MRFVLSVALAVVCMAQMPGDKAAVEGQVVNRKTGAPLAGAQIRLAGVSGSQTSAATDRKGHFSVTGLDAGEYRVEAERTGFVPLAWNKVRLTLAAGEQVKDFTVSLVPQAVISGTVLDADGVPVANAYVQAMRYTWQRGKRILANVGGAQPNESGEFRIAGLATGDYLIQAMPRQLAAAPREDKVKRIYVGTWYPGVTEAGLASPIHVAAGEEHTGVEMTLRTSTVVNVRGRVVHAAMKSPLTAAIVMLTRIDESGAEAQVLDPGGMTPANGQDGAFTLPDVAPGRYQVTALVADLSAGSNAFENSASASQTLQVGDRDVEDITLSPTPPQSLSGVLKWEGKPPKDAGSCIVALAPETRGLAAQVAPATTKPDGAFTLSSVPPVHSELNAHCEAKGSYLKAACLGDIDVLEKGLDGSEALPQGPLQITMASDAGGIAGNVADGDQHPAAGATVVAVPEDSKRPALFHSTVSDQKGHFEFTDVVPGAYMLYAWDEVDGEIWRDEEFLKKYAQRAERVKVDSSGHVAATLKVIKAE